MGSNIEEALRAKAEAERRFLDNDFVGAKMSAIKAETLCPGLDGIAQMVLTYGVHSASQMRINGEIDLYAVLGLDPSADKAKVKKQYKKMYNLLQPDRNKTIGADGAFKLVSQAWAVLSDVAKRNSYDCRRNSFSHHTSGKSINYSNSSSMPRNRLETFWTVCTSCHVQYEYLRKYVNKRLSCKNCRGVFNAVETGLAPVNGSYQYSSWSYVPENGFGTHGYGAQHNGVSGHHSRHGLEYAPNISFTQTAQVNGTMGKRKMEKAATGFTVYTEKPVKKMGRPAKKTKVEIGSTSGNNTAEEVKVTNENGNLKQISKLQTANDTSSKRCSYFPSFDSRKLLIDKARTVIRSKLEEINLASAELDKKKKEFSVIHKRVGSGDLEKHPSEPKASAALAITVPDSDFHDFDKDRAEESFKPKQIWALYDEEDGMPRLYCLVREVINLNPFKIHVSYLGAKSDTEFGSVNWLCSGFTKSCGHFRAYNSEIVDQINIFSHHLSREKAGRGGCIRIFPRSGDIWAVYRNWSLDWNRSTPDEVRHQYEMVEVLDDYSEELGVRVGPLIKLDGFKTVYRQSLDKESIRWIPRKEMLRFSHMVPSCVLEKNHNNLPDGRCWDLDPAATPEELLQGGVEEAKGGLPVSSSRNNNVGTEGKTGGQPESSALSGLSHESVSEVQQVQTDNHNLNEPPGFPQNHSEPPGFPQNCTEPPGFPQIHTEPPGFPLNLAEPPSFPLNPTEPPGFPLNLTEPPGFPLNLTEPPGFPLNLTEPPGFPLNLTEPPGFPLNLTEPPGFTLNLSEPADFLQNLPELPSFLQNHTKQPGFGQTLFEPPGFGHTLIEPPGFGHTLNRPPGFGQNLNEPPPGFSNLWEIRNENGAVKQNKLRR
ncbi:unnamed protein product [Cuscuta europaea]|uniref:J domain-containing protein n=1 Tax=Cuscuta europaea TaxID=41803 RepID=A0A9P0ZXJ7_CUSEU|nr:unnamed protein product [Cuscuta europaea]